ncbi:hypothetical protein HK097_006454 [Rhizophlyctis rosea]|uniref:Phosphatidate phosphatase APP1 catalytic domain-containing protein n=1 Tax=Rhizophlyctis rosea TaxID=64517 RepID=A0AAD5SDB1_9FUNG|nr:hypothetical protein HK097_006454 [Rhizophlyctis rosea]
MSNLWSRTAGKIASFSAMVGERPPSPSSPRAPRSPRFRPRSIRTASSRSASPSSSISGKETLFTEGDPATPATPTPNKDVIEHILFFPTYAHHKPTPAQEARIAALSRPPPPDPAQAALDGKLESPGGKVPFDIPPRVSSKASDGSTLPETFDGKLEIASQQAAINIDYDIAAESPKPQEVEGADETDWVVQVRGWAFATNMKSLTRRVLVSVTRKIFSASFLNTRATPEHLSNYDDRVGLFLANSREYINVRVAIVGLAPSEKVLAQRRSAARAEASDSEYENPESIFLDSHDEMNDDEGKGVEFDKLETDGPGVYAATFRTDDDGFFSGSITLPNNVVEMWRREHGEDVLDHHAVRVVAFKPGNAATLHSFSSVELIPPTGISLISDVDDTIKDSSVHIGKVAAFNAAFFAEPKEVTGMADCYNFMRAKGVRFHYVSGGPYQLYPMVSQFLQTHSFPTGSLNLRDVWEGRDTMTTQKYKHQIITGIFKDFPLRKFILVGDSGEKDIEIYSGTHAVSPRQVVKIFIRDVTTGSNLASRLAHHAGDMDADVESFIPTAGQVTAQQAVLMGAAQGVPAIQVRCQLAYSGVRDGGWKLFKNPDEILVDEVVRGALEEVLAYCLYKPLQPRRHPRYKPHRDVTIVVPTIDSGEEIKLAIRTWLKSDPYGIIFVTIPSAFDALEGLAREVDPQKNKIKVITVKKPNKRCQMVAGANHVKTEITVFCDDDVLWPETMLKWMLAPFEDKQMGGVGTSQAVLPVRKRFTIWEVLAAFRISMRNIEIVSTTYIDGGVCCLSGRTAAYRTKILRDPDFQWKFTHEFWLGKYHQHSGDDKFLTRWLHSHAYKSFIQACPEAELQSTFKDNWRFLKQLLRWTRNTWRSDFRSLFSERYIWSRHPFVAFTMLDKIFNPITLLAGPITVTYLCTRPDRTLPIWTVIVSYLLWLTITRLIKYMPHFVKRPQDVIAIPVWLIFNIYFAIMKIYCLCTLHITDWGTRAGADDTHDEGEDMAIYEPHWQDGRKDQDGGSAPPMPKADEAEHDPDAIHVSTGQNIRAQDPCHAAINIRPPESVVVPMGGGGHPQMTQMKQHPGLQHLYHHQQQQQGVGSPAHRSLNLSVMTGFTAGDLGSSGPSTPGTSGTSRGSRGTQGSSERMV